ncbi:hypothetical protein MBLNU457_3597t2 [Dothideomycetes sp. NU457]
MEYENEQRGYDDEPQYRERSRSPRPDRDGDTRLRSASPRGDRERGGASAAPREQQDDDQAPNEGSNLFVTGISPRLTESEIQRLFEKYGEVENCSIMRDPHTRESRGFGFVKMVTSEQADAAKNGLNGEVYEGRTLSIEKARRSKPRTPTPGKYFGPPKREDRPPRRGGGYRDRYDDRGYGRRDDYGGGYRSRDRYGGDRGGDRYDDRGYGGGRRDDYGRRDRDDYAPARGSSYRDDRSYGGREERRGGGSGGGYGYDRAPRGGASDAYAEPAAPAAGGSRSGGGYADDRYERR